MSTCLSGSPPNPLPPVRDPATGSITCLPGYYCPRLDPSNASTYPIYCIATPECSLERLFGREVCDDVQSVYEPRICKAGRYCPTSQQEIDCPSGKFCTLGSVQPNNCPPMSICPSKSSSPREFGPLIFLVILMVAVVVIRQLYLRIWRLRGQAPGAPAPQEGEPVLRLNDESHQPDAPTSVGGLMTGASSNFVPTELDRQLAHHFRAVNQSQRSIRLDFAELQVKISPSKENPAGKQLLEGVTGTLKPGTVTAILGPSGAGKTVLLTTLLQRVSPDWNVQGSMLVNNGQGNFSDLRNYIGFVPQDDVLHNELTVEANLYYASEMRLPKEWDATRRAEMREVVLSALGLQDHRTSVIGTESERGVSGGQRKRVSIGVELVSAPLMLFLDEPTSGLDSTTSLELVRTLKSIAVAANITIAMVIHQPRVEIWDALDELLILGVGGRTVFKGRQAAAQPYFASQGIVFDPKFNPADVIVDTVVVNSSEWADRWAARDRRGLLSPDVQARFPQHVVEGRDPVEELLILGPADVIVDSVAVVSTTERASRWVASDPPSDPVNPLLLLGPDAQSHFHQQPEVERWGTLEELLLLGPADGVVDPVNGWEPEGPSDPVTPLLLAPDAQAHFHGAHPVRQYGLFAVRSFEKQLSDMTAFVVEVIVIFLCGLVLGNSMADFAHTSEFRTPYEYFSPATNELLLPQLHMYQLMSLGLAAAVAGVNVFGTERPQYFREVPTGMSRLAYFLANVSAALPRVGIVSLVYAAVFTFLASLPVPFQHLYFSVMLCYWAIYGLGACISVTASRAASALIASTGSICFAVFNGFIDFPVWMKRFTPGFYASQVLQEQHARWIAHWSQNSMATRATGYEAGRLTESYALMIILVVALHVIAFALMVLTHRDRQR